MLRMFYKKDNCFVDVYKIFDDKTVMIFSPFIADKQNGNGWNIVKIGQLIPEEYYNNNFNSIITGNERSKIKKRLTIIQAKWACTDGTIFNDCDKAIAYEHELIKKENENNAK